MTQGETWIQLLGSYAAHEDGATKALFHERMERYIDDIGVLPIEFLHPMEEEVLSLFDNEVNTWTNVILAGEAGVGKTRLVHKIHLKLGGNAKRLKARGASWIHEGIGGKNTRFRAHMNRDLSASRFFGAKGTPQEEAKRIETWSRLILGEEPETGIREFFVIAANDGQLLRAWQDHSGSEKVRKALAILEHCLLTGTQPDAEIPLRLFHMSSVETDVVLAQCIDAVVGHPGWQALEAEHSGTNDLFAPDSPLRRNYMALRDATVRRRLVDLARLCDSNDWHLPVRNILAMLANALLGSSDRRASSYGVMDVEHIRTLMAEGRSDASNFFANILGLNLEPDWREKVLGPLESFRVGLETSNQADNLILFGPDDDDYKSDYEKLFLQDPVFPPDSVFNVSRVHYLSVGLKEVENGESTFQQQLVAQRRRLFFRTPPEMESRYNPWSMTNFHHAKEYLEQLLAPAREGRAPHPRNLGPLVLALNRIWTGMLLDERDQLFVTTALDFATGNSSEIEVRRIPTRASSGGEHPFVDLESGDQMSQVPRITIHLRDQLDPVSLPLTLTRFEFLKRVATGALPTSFSRECSEDIWALKSRVLARLAPPPAGGSLKLLHVNNDGTAGCVILNLSGD
ncbi:MAG: hypothetical protein WCK89_03955 [bacterium]